MGELIVKVLEAAGQDQVSRFRMSDAEDQQLQIFIRRHAKKSTAALLTQTYVAKVDTDTQVIGYVSIMCAEVKLDGCYSLTDKVGADHYEYQPAVRIARLAVCDGYRRNGLRVGRKLLDSVIGVIVASILPYAGCRFIILDAKRKSIQFYENYGFRMLATETNQVAESPIMFLDLKTIT